MTDFRTIVDIQESDFKIDHFQKLSFIGSCFTDHIGKKCSESGIASIINPLGVVYNPISVKNCIELIIKKKEFLEDDLHFYQDVWFSFYHYTGFSNSDKATCLQNINDGIINANSFLKESNVIFITLATSWVYQYKETGQIVSNCHKLPANSFSKILLDVDQVVKSMTEINELLTEINPSVKIIFSISPVRHWKDGACGNQVSKSILILAIKKITQLFSNVSYFPAYEIMMDELRDYRFYANDMLHVSDIAIEYIWERFSATYFTEKTRDLNREIYKIFQAKNHHIINIHSSSTKQFVEQVLSKINQLEKKNPQINITDIKKYFSDLLNIILK